MGGPPMCPAKHPDRELLGVGGDYLDHVERALQR